MNQEIKKLIELLSQSESDFSKGMPKIEQEILKDIEKLLRSLEYSGDNIKVNAKNLRQIKAFENKINQIVLNEEYVKSVQTFVDKFNEVEALNEEYYKSIKGDFKTSSTLTLIKEQTQQTTAQMLTEQGIRANVSERISNVISSSIREGSNGRGLIKELKELIEGDANNGILKKYTGQIVTDSINQYSANYTQIASEGLGLEWYQYVGSLVGDSRPFCEAMVNNEFIHVSQFQEAINGNINGTRVPIYPKTGLPNGMISGTNTSNLVTRRGGYRCNHLMIAVMEDVVPESKKAAIS